MRNYSFRLLFLALACLSALYMSASIRSAEEALQIANQQTAMRKAGNSAAPFKLLATRNQPNVNTPAFYILQRESQQGFMLVSAETTTPAILAYNETGAFDTLRMPANVRFWMDRYAQQIAIISQQKTHRMAPRKSYTPVSPLIGVEWDQTAPFNNDCPWDYDNEGRSVTGCVATAFAQVMYFHKYPTQGTGSHSYTWHDNTLSVDFSSATYDWNNMLSSYDGYYNDQQANAVAQLMYHMGVACEMNYSATGSGSNGTTAAQALVKYFGYNPDITPYHLDYHGEEIFMKAITQELAIGRPFVMEGIVRNGGGHEFVCEGIDADGKLYINWGWGGYYNGYFELTLLSPAEQGTGGSDGAYTDYIGAYVGIRPYDNGEKAYALTVDIAEIHSAERIKKSDEIRYTLTNLWNVGVNDWSGYLCMYLTDNKGDIISQQNNPSSIDLGVLNFYQETKISGSFPNLAAGNYFLHLGYTTSTGDDTPHPLAIRRFGEPSIPVVVTKDSIFINNANITQECRFHEVTFYNLDGYNLWYVELYSKFFNSSASIGTDMALKFYVNNSSTSSIIGSFYSDNSSQNGTIENDEYLIFSFGQSGNSDDAQPVVEITFAFDSQKRLIVNYYIAVSEREWAYAGADTILPQNQYWYTYDNFSSSAYDLAYTTDVVVAFSTQKALQIGSNLEKGSWTIPYMVKGIVQTKPVIQDGMCSFDMYSEESPNDILHVTNCNWLDGALYDMEYMAIGDTIFMLAQMVRDNYDKLYAQGNIYQHTPGFIQPRSGQCGENLSWQYSNKTLYIIGSNDMYSYGSDDAPWYFFKDSITTIVIDAQVTSIGDGAFYGFSQLQQIICQAINPPSLGTNVFSGTGTWSDIKLFIPNESFKDYSNNNGWNVFNIQVIPTYLVDGIWYQVINQIAEVIPAATGYSYYDLTDVDIPDYIDIDLGYIHVEAINSKAFYGCTQLSTLTLGCNINAIRDKAFAGCISLSKITCNAEKPCNILQTTFDQDAYSTVTVFVPFDCRSLYKSTSGWNLFNNIKPIPKRIEEIYYALYSDYAEVVAAPKSSYYKQFESITIPAKVEYRNKTYPVTSIESNTFRGCNELTKLTLPESLTRINTRAFARCSALKQVTCLAVIPPSMGNDIFNDCDVYTIPLYVHQESIDAYRSADQWNEFKQILPIEEPIDAIRQIDDQQNVPDNSKVLYNGQLLILHNGKMYNAQGNLMN